MKKVMVILGVAALVLSCQSEKKTSDAANSNATEITTVDNSMTSLDWEGTYKGTLPCADCAGIEFTLTLNADKSYSLTRTYQTTPEANYASAGNFVWDENGSKISLQGTDEDNKFSFLIGENKALLLDQEGNVITGDLADNYVLTKVTVSAATTNGIMDKRWKLVELMGQPVTYDGENAIVAFITLKEEGKANGCFGCNDFHGTYTIDEEVSRISFSPMATTRKMCIDMEIETKFAEVLSTVDNYNLIEDGTKLVLNKARMAPLARFEVEVE